MNIKNKDGGDWVATRHIGWVVATAGRIDLEPLFVSRHEIPTNFLPAGFRATLKDIDIDGKAWIYHDSYGVIRLPRELLVAWDR